MDLFSASSQKLSFSFLVSTQRSSAQQLLQISLLWTPVSPWSHSLPADHLLWTDRSTLRDPTLHHKTSVLLKFSLPSCPYRMKSSWCVRVNNTGTHPPRHTFYNPAHTQTHMPASSLLLSFCASSVLTPDVDMSFTLSLKCFPRIGRAHVIPLHSGSGAATKSFVLCFSIPWNFYNKNVFKLCVCLVFVLWSFRATHLTPVTEVYCPHSLTISSLPGPWQSGFMPNNLPELDPQRAPVTVVLVATSFRVLALVADANRDNPLPPWHSLLPWPLWDCPLSSVAKWDTFHWKTLPTAKRDSFSSKVEGSDRHCRMGRL